MTIRKPGDKMKNKTSWGRLEQTQYIYIKIYKFMIPPVLLAFIIRQFFFYRALHFKTQYKVTKTTPMTYSTHTYFICWSLDEETACGPCYCCRWRRNWQWGMDAHPCHFIWPLSYLSKAWRKTESTALTSDQSAFRHRFLQPVPPSVPTPVCFFVSLC